MLSLALTGVSLAVLAASEPPARRAHPRRTSSSARDVGVRAQVGRARDARRRRAAFMIPPPTRRLRLRARARGALQPYDQVLHPAAVRVRQRGHPARRLQPAPLAESLPLGIAAGLALGKPLRHHRRHRTFATRRGLARLPDGCTWRHVIGVGCLAGIGFTMSLFIGSLAFGSPDLATSVRVGVIAGSSSRRSSASRSS